jgi:hypothetical protein
MPQSNLAVAVAVVEPSVQPGAVAVQSASAQQNTEYRGVQKQPAAESGTGSADRASQPREPAAAEMPLAQPGAVAVQRASNQQKKKVGTSLKQPAAQPEAGSADQASQPREPTAAGPATTSKKGSKDQDDIEGGQIAPPSGTVDVKQEKVCSAKGGASNGAVRSETMAVQPGTITTQSAETSASVATMHTASHAILRPKAAISHRRANAPSSRASDILTSKAAIANRTAALQGRRNWIYTD